MTKRRYLHSLTSGRLNIYRILSEQFRSISAHMAARCGRKVDVIRTLEGDMFCKCPRWWLWPGAEIMKHPKCSSVEPRALTR
jgi:hypothetical protein